MTLTGALALKLGGAPTGSCRLPLKLSLSTLNPSQSVCPVSTSARPLPAALSCSSSVKFQQHVAPDGSRCAASTAQHDTSVVTFVLFEVMHVHRGRNVGTAAQQCGSSEGSCTMCCCVRRHWQEQRLSRTCSKSPWGCSVWCSTCSERDLTTE